jgi:hypothetical protein
MGLSATFIIVPLSNIYNDENTLITDLLSSDQNEQVTVRDITLRKCPKVIMIDMAALTIGHNFPGIERMPIVLQLIVGCGGDNISVEER